MPAPRLWVYISAVILAASLSYGVARMPLQVHDALEEIIAARQSPGVWASFTSTIGETTYFRPLRIAETKLLFDVSGGHYFAAYKMFHVALLAAAFALFVTALHLETGADVAAALFALTVFTGLHTFLGFVREAFPVNHFLQVAVLVLVAVRLSRTRGARWIDAAAISAFVAACLTLESGVLVWVAVVASRAAGRRGVSDRAIGTMTALLVIYVFVRFVWLAPQVQGMVNPSGYWFERLEGAQIRERFGNGLTRFNIYNVLVSAATVLISEPRGGVFVAARAWSVGDVPPRMWINLVSSLITTVLIAIAAWRLRGARSVAPYLKDDLLIFAAVLAASALASFAYAKDEIMSVAGVFYALAAGAALRELLAGRLRGVPAAVLALALLVAGSGWAVRTIGVNHVLRAQAFAVHNDWAWLPEEMQRRGTWPDNPATRRLVLDLREESLRKPIVNPWFTPRWSDRVFDADYF